MTYIITKIPATDYPLLWQIAEGEKERNKSMENMPKKSYDEYLLEATKVLVNVKFGVPSLSGGYDGQYFQFFDDPSSFALSMRTAATKPSEAIKAIISNPTKWLIDCALFVQIAHLYAGVMFYGSKKFDNEFYDERTIGYNFILTQHDSSGITRGRQYQKEDRNSVWTKVVMGEDSFVDVTPFEVGIISDSDVNDFNAKNGVDQQKIIESKLLIQVPFGTRLDWSVKPIFNRAYTNENAIKVSQTNEENINISAYVETGNAYKVTLKEFLSILEEHKPPSGEEFYLRQITVIKCILTK